MNAIAPHADHHISLGNVLARDDLVEVDAADGHSNQIKAVHDVLQLCRLAAGNGNLGQSGTFAKPDADRVEHGGIGMLDRDVINK